jgi:prephenate dehydrogenase
MNIGFIGFGSLGQLLGRSFAKDNSVSFYDPKVNYVKGLTKCKDLDELVYKNQFLILAIPSSSFKAVVSKISQLDLNNKLIVDVLSTKTLAINIYQEALSPTINILSLHPLFGPPSMKKLVPGLRVVSVLKQGQLAIRFEDYLKSEYKLNIVNVSAEYHDKHMAIHHAIPFLLAHALAKTDFNKDPGELTIPSEEKLRQIVDIASKESTDLYYTIMKSNPYALQAIDKLIETINNEKKLLGL